MTGPPRTWREAWARTAELVGDRQHARWMCETAGGATSQEFLLELDGSPTDRALAHLDRMVERRRTGEPLQYVLGSWSFRRLDLAVDRRVLIPRPETELVAGIAIELAGRVPGPRVVVDVGTGSGAIGLSCAFELPLDDTTVWLTDVSDEALDVARANLAGLGRAARNVRIVSGDWLDALPAEVRADVIVSNPPYVAIGDPTIAAEVRDWEPAVALFGGGDGLDAYRAIADAAVRRLAPGGSIVLEIGSTQGRAITDLLRAAGCHDVEIRPDHAGLDRVAVGQP
jgi:release factor glutamine methyltransferase